MERLDTDEEIRKIKARIATVECAKLLLNDGTPLSIADFSAMVQYISETGAKDLTFGGKKI